MSNQSGQRPRFKSTQNWNDFIASGGPLGQINGDYLLHLRKQCYTEIEKIRGRPLLIYATRFLDPLPPNTPNSIDLSDIDGFTDLVNSIPDGDSIDVFLHSPGGRPDATERIVNILRNRFNEVHFIIPHSAYSAATMLSLSGDSILIHPSATLGPIDPQINGIPARSIKRGFEKVKEIIKTEGPEALPAYIPLIEKYTLDLLEICDDSEKLSKELVSDWLYEYMFKGKASSEQISEIVTYFSDYDKHLIHSRPLILKKIQKFGLSISIVDGELKDLIWEAYIMINGFFGATPFYKLYECAHGVSWGRQFQMVMQNPQQTPHNEVK